MSDVSSRGSVANMQLFVKEGRVARLIPQTTTSPEHNHIKRWLIGRGRFKFYVALWES